MGVGDVAVVQNLQENVQHIGVGLLDLVKEDHRVGFSADLLGELASLVVAHIARGRADDSGDSVLLHKLGHVQPDKGLGGVEEILSQLLDQLGLAHTGGANKDERDRLVLGADAHPTPADGGGDCLDRLILADDVLLEPLLQLGELLILLLLDLAGRDVGPQLNDVGQMLHPQGGDRLGLQLVLLRLQAQLLAADVSQTGVGLLRVGGHHYFLLFIQIGQLLGDGGLPGQRGVFQVHVGTGLVNEVDGLVREIAVGDVPLTHGHR